MASRTDASWVVPKEIRLEEGRLWWRPGGEEKASTEHMLTDFASIHRADSPEARDASLLSFATEFGPIHLCRHGKPATHVPPATWREIAPWLVEEESVPCEGDERRHGQWGQWSGWHSEPTEPWVSYSAAADAVLDLGGQMSGALEEAEDLGRSDWLALQVLLMGPVDTLDSLKDAVGWSFLDPPVLDESSEALAALSRHQDEDRRKAVHDVELDLRGQHRRMLARAVQQWLDIGGVSLHLDWSEPHWRRPDFFIRYQSMFAGLGLELALFLSGQSKIGFCHACKQPTPLSRRATPGRYSWCTDPDCRKAKNRMEQQRSRSKS